MTYIFLVAGRGTRLNPLTKNYPKTLFKLEKNSTILGEMIKMIREYDSNPRIVVVTGFMYEEIENHLKDEEVIFVRNPFYAVTNSLASLWFAREYLDSDTVIINGDIIVSKDLMRDVITKKVDRCTALIDSSIKTDGDYNVEIMDDHIVIMGKELEKYYGEFVGLIQFDANSAKLLCREIDSMVKKERYDQWYEDTLVQLIFEEDFVLYYNDICGYDWTEIDSINDLLHARKIHTENKKK